MCQFKSAIVTKNGRVLHKPGIDSHTDILTAFGLSAADDDGESLVPIEVYPDDWADIGNPDKYQLHIDCDIVPRWFTASRQRVAEADVRRAVGDMLTKGCFQVGGHLYLDGYAGLKALPENLKGGGFLYLGGCTGLKALPENLKVGGLLDLDGCTATVPPHLQTKVR